MFNNLLAYVTVENIYLAGLAAGQNKASSILKAKALIILIQRPTFQLDILL